MGGLLLTCFGTSYEETRVKTIDALCAKLRAEFPDMAFYDAWLSKRIIAKVERERGEHHDTLEEALERLSADGVDDLIVVTICLMQGKEMSIVEESVRQWTNEGGRSARVTKPLLASEDDCQAIARVIANEFDDLSSDDALLLMGHGSEFGGNEAYGRMQVQLNALEPSKFFVATVEGTPTFDDVWPLIQERGAKRVVLTPLMIVAGDHARNDLAGDDDDSWASRIRANGLQVDAVLRGLGEYEGVHDLVCSHVQDALMLREVALRG